METEVSMLLQRRCVWMLEQGEMPVAEGPMSKVFSTEALERASQDVIELVGADGLRSYLEPTAPEHGRFEHSAAVLVGYHDLCGYQRSPAHHHRAARARPTPLAS